MIDGTLTNKIPRKISVESDRFHAVYTRNITRVYRLCYLKLGHKEDAEDAAQNVFLRWMKTQKVFLSEEHEKAYFLRAAANECINTQKAMRRQVECDPESLPDALVSVSEEEAFADSGVLHDDGAQVILQKLPVLYREVLYLYYCEELSTKAIAKTLSRKESTVRTQLQVGRERLRKLYEEESK